MQDFRIQFASDHLKRVTRARFDLYIEKQLENVLVELDSTITKLCKKREAIISAKSLLVEKWSIEASVLKKRRYVHFVY